MTLPRAALVSGAAYWLRARNLRLGVWSDVAGGFIGIREKFGREFLDTESLAGSQFGTALAVARVEADPVPAGVALRELLGVVDSLECRAVRRTGGGYVYADTGGALEGGAVAVLVPNAPLMAYLRGLDLRGSA
ncbi:hypothetical protein [Deinococcus soli (ex Cha et al. 2016)]|uniref:Uncharacterized protein n=2 Tax=Deinococcus soli (ex Cha et al. 2016) TaxID=1309411 RepID=A0AAE4BMI9_9DEIO|nr:hypothetical protein [Deinococcus soli (ex Cha et al. 2016)]MDR6218542.1 hypothetical protein [Deinococcus soli (ex Cha et al. 2016)]MDR6329282.1 hypothetical protein [Deinococcus soli (ex Cha et al. 2016)]MDR6751555.1 hypothetical protein [Deinococcus soli (ex Cha et al. 2016)]